MPHEIYSRQEVDDLLAPIQAALTDHENRLAALEGSPPPQPPTATLTATPGSIETGQAAFLEWTTTNADTVTLDGVAMVPNGSMSVSPTADQTYTLVAQGTGGSVTKAVTVTVTQPGGFQWPGPQGDVTIPAGTTVVLDTMTAEVRDLTIDGTLQVSPTVDTKLIFRTISGSGTLQIGTDTVPISASCRFVKRDVPLDPADTEQMGGGVHFMGAVTMYGQAKTPYCRLAGEALAGDTVLALDRVPSGWQVGDELAIADSRNIDDPQDLAQAWKRDRVTLQAVNDNQITVTPILTDKPQGKNRDGSLVSGLTAHVVNLTRNVVIESENPAGVRGHFMVHDTGSIHGNNFVLRNLGRTTIDPLDDVTNHIGRYAGIHLHMLGDATGRVDCQDYVVDGGNFDHRFKWGTVIHATQNAIVKNGVIFNIAGAGVVFGEDGTETDNLVEGCGVIYCYGEGSRADSSYPGREGSGFWGYRANGNRLKNNWAANCFLFGFTHYGGGPYLEHDGNECYGGRRGITMWEINGADTGNPNPDAPESFIDNFKVWNCWDIGVGLGYPAYNVTWRNLLAIGMPSGIQNWGFTFGDYRTRNLKLINPIINGFRGGIQAPMVDAPSEFLIDHPILDNIEIDLQVAPQIVAGGGGWTPQARTVRVISPVWDAAKVSVTDADPANQVIVE